MSTVAERVSAGIALLDERVPGWQNKINLEEFDIRHTRKCILGQVFEGYDDEGSSKCGYDIGIRVLKIDECPCCPSDGEGFGSAFGRSVYDHGFDAWIAVGQDPVDVQMDELQEEWKRQLSIILA